MRRQNAHEGTFIAAEDPWQNAHEGTFTLQKIRLSSDWANPLKGSRN